MPILIISAGPDKGRLFELTEGQSIVLGREGDQFQLRDRKVSPRHARIWSEGVYWYIEDLGSGQGTYRNHIKLDIGQQATIDDGDTLRIGKTEMSFDMMPAEHAKKLAMLAGMNESDQTKPHTRGGGFTKFAAGVSVVALLGMGGYIAWRIDGLQSESVPRSEFVKLQEQLVEAQRQQSDRIAASIDRHANLSEKLLGNQKDLTDALGQTTATIGKHEAAIANAADLINGKTVPILEKLDAVTTQSEQQQASIQRIGQMLADQQANDPTPQFTAALKQFEQTLAGQPKADVLLAKLEEAVKSNAQAAGEAVQLALAEHRKEVANQALLEGGTDPESVNMTNALLNRVIEGLAKVPTQEQISREVQLAVAGRDQVNEQFMRQVLAEVRSAISEDAQRTEVLVARAINEAGNEPTAKEIARELQAAGNDSAERTAKLLEKVLAKVQTQQELGDQIAKLQIQVAELPGRNTEAVREVLARLDAQSENNVELIQSIAQLKAAMPKDLPGQLDQVLAQLDKQVRTEQITDEIEKVMQRVAASQNAEADAMLAKLTEQLSSMPSSEELSSLVQSQASLATLLETSDARDAIGELRTSLELLSKKIGADEDGDPLDQIVSMLKKREKVELMLAELHDAMLSQSTQTKDLKRELLTAIDSIVDPQTNQQLSELMGMVQTRMATESSVRQAIRDEMRGTMLPNQMAQADARDITTSNRAVSASPRDSSPASSTTPRLSPVESAYKKSFETGKPITVGAGAVDPQTGQVSRGRRIDPAIAKELGFESWRDWYLTDRHAEQMRLQQEAIRQRNANDQANNRGTITLPE